MEQHLIKEAKSGNAAAIEKLYRHFYGYAMSVALRYTNTRDEACEVVNDSYLKAFNKLDQYSTGSSFKGWFRRIIINTSIDNYRKNQKHYAVLEIDKAAAESYDSDAVDDLTKEEILGMLRELPEILRIVFNMYEIEGFSHKEIGEELGFPSSSSRTYLARAKQKLREKFIALNEIRDEGAVR
ncbi:RNA polymerase sigma factor [Litoribacter populi]|uniref:RNA polymerase sigma factor n=1 Tax=Litoribacter populi TaxID=2598460 RepID=UPI001180FA4A|nr:RNA polymerase sigma factor [Litoribacter populi]